MTKITDPIKLEEARARMAKARASRTPMKHPDSVEQRVGTVRQLVVRQFTDAGLSAADDGKLLGADSSRYYYNKLVKGSLTLKDMILLGDYMPVDWTLIFKSIRQPKDVLRPVDVEAAPIDMEFSEPGDNPFAGIFTDVDGA
ncbi:MAG: hypothetical protein HXN12_00215 [Porphyromonadaceae bacterium]|nr:hypothetical protein [Porphyromonadaceae bacterium]